MKEEALPREARQRYWISFDDASSRFRRRASADDYDAGFRTLRYFMISLLYSCQNI